MKVKNFSLVLKKKKEMGGGREEISLSPYSGDPISNK